MFNQEINLRSKALLGDKFDYLANFKVAVIGIGGVGSIIPLSLIRSGFKKILLIDFDKVNYSNLNRQLAYTSLDINKYKVEVLKEKLLKFNDEAKVTIYNKKVDENFDFSILNDADFVFDCIDILSSKAELIAYLSTNNINFISSLGMGNKLDPSKLTITKLNKTTIDPLAKKLRYLLKKKNVDLSKVNVCFSSETNIINNRKVTSMVFVPNSAGLMMASYCLNFLLGGK